MGHPVCALVTGIGRTGHRIIERGLCSGLTTVGLIATLYPVAEQSIITGEGGSGLTRSGSVTRLVAIAERVVVAGRAGFGLCIRDGAGGRITGTEIIPVTDIRCRAAYGC